MYFIDIKLAIFSNEFDRIEMELSRLELPEDCGLTLIRAYTLSDVPDQDSAVIFDSNPDLICSYAGHALRALMFEASENESIDEEALSASDFDIVMPRGGRYDPYSLRKEFLNLIKYVKVKADKLRAEICLNTAIDSVPDMVWFKDTEGHHLKVNSAFCDVVKKTKEDIYKKGHCYIWDVPESEAHACSASDERVMKERKTLLFEENVKMDIGLRLIRSYKSPLIDTQGKVFGNCGIGHDITSLRNINKELSMIIESIPFGTLLLNTEGYIINANQSLRVLFPDAGDPIGRDYKKWYASLNATPVDDLNGLRIFSISQSNGTRIVEVNSDSLLDVFGSEKGRLVLFIDVTLSYSYEQQTIKDANTDYLTGLQNRRGLNKYFNANPADIGYTVATIDLDHFKAVNDTFGHNAGDRALIMLATELKSYFPDDFVVRIGGDEFMIVTDRQMTKEESELKINGFIHHMLHVYSEFDSFKGLSMSVGVSSRKVIHNEHELDDLIRRSDEALYIAKRNGRARVEFLD